MLFADPFQRAEKVIPTLPVVEHRYYGAKRQPMHAKTCAANFSKALAPSRENTTTKYPKYANGKTKE
ncbi:MAG: hypothetical protein M9920_17010 [Verrucomicrobiae bacterium]|nr:hypothetical protein [Verrucomicrobiae bacterium]